MKNKFKTSFEVKEYLESLNSSILHGIISEARGGELRLDAQRQLGILSAREEGFEMVVHTSINGNDTCSRCVGKVSKYNRELSQVQFKFGDTHFRIFVNEDQIMKGILGIAEHSDDISDSIFREYFDNDKE